MKNKTSYHVYDIVLYNAQDWGSLPFIINPTYMYH